MSETSHDERGGGSDDTNDSDDTDDTNEIIENVKRSVQFDTTQSLKIISPRGSNYSSASSSLDTSTSIKANNKATPLTNRQSNPNRATRITT